MKFNASFSTNLKGNSSNVILSEDGITMIYIFPIIFQLNNKKGQVFCIYIYTFSLQSWRALTLRRVEKKVTNTKTAEEITWLNSDCSMFKLLLLPCQVKEATWRCQENMEGDEGHMVTLNSDSKPDCLDCAPHYNISYVALTAC